MTYAELKKAYIETPSTCYKVDKIDGKRIYLKSTAEVCIQTIGKVRIEIDESIKHIFIYTDGKFWKEQTLTEFNLDSIYEYMEKVDKLKNDLKVPENLYKEKVQEIAEKTYQFYQPKKFQGKLKAKAKRLKDEVFKKPVEEYYSDSKEIRKIKGNYSRQRGYTFLSLLQFPYRHSETMPYIWIGLETRIL